MQDFVQTCMQNLPTPYFYQHPWVDGFTGTGVSTSFFNSVDPMFWSPCSKLRGSRHAGSGTSSGSAESRSTRRQCSFPRPKTHEACRYRRYMQHSDSTTRNGGFILNFVPVSRIRKSSLPRNFCFLCTGWDLRERPNQIETNLRGPTGRPWVSELESLQSHAEEPEIDRVCLDRSFPQRWIASAIIAAAVILYCAPSCPALP
jgi:hypothetical protein